MEKNILEGAFNFNIVSFKFNGAIKYTVWYIDRHEDEKFMVSDNKIVIFKNKENANEYLKRYGYCAEEVIFFDVDLIKREIENNIVNSGMLLDFWNISIDILKATSIDVNEGECYNEIYDKLFFGENLPTMNTSDKVYNPVFCNTEKKVLKEIITNYIALLNKIFC